MNIFTKLVAAAFLISNTLWANAPVWKQGNIALSAYAGNHMQFELNRLVLDTGNLQFRLNSPPPMLSLGTTFTRGVVTLEGQSELSDIGTFNFTIEATNDQKTWVPAQFHLTIAPRPAMTCTDGTEAKQIGTLPEYEIYSCKTPNPTP